MPDYTQTHIDRALTNISVAYFQTQSFIADKIFPIVPVQRQSDLFFKYKIGDFLRDEAKVRGRIAESAGGDYEVETDSYHAFKYAFHKDVAPEDRVNAENPLNVDIDSTYYVSQKMAIRREAEFADKYFKAGVWGTEYTGGATTAGTTKAYWNLDTSDPITDITDAAIVMEEKTGFKPNTLVLSPYVFNKLKSHFDILDRIKYTEKGIVTTALLASLFEVDNVYVARSVVNKGIKQGTDDIGFIAGKNALLCYSAPRPGLRTASAGYIFAWTGLDGSGAFGNRIVRIPMDLLGLGVERIEGEMAFDMKVVAPDLGVFFNGIVE